MGDSLKAASRFVSQSMNSLDDLMTATPLSNGTAINHLASLQSRAKTMRARSIYRAAQTAVDMIHKGDSEQRVQSEFVLIRSLVEQYKSGLDELLVDVSPMDSEAEIKEVSSHQAISLVRETPIVSPVNDMIDSLNMQLQTTFAGDLPETKLEMKERSVAVEAEAEAEAEAETFAEAAEVLAPLIQLAPKELQRDSLKNLSKLHNLSAHETDVKAPVAKLQNRSVEFESLMPELTNFVLTEARHAGKTVSISYAANSVRLGQEVADILRDALIVLTSILVRRSLETQEVRRDRRESGAGHISLTSTLVQGKVHLVVECTGRDIDANDLDHASWRRLQTLGGTVILGREADRFTLTLKDLAVYAQSHKRRVNEAGFNIGQAS
ncbi:MAG: hypothetical protein ABJ275_11325 [Maricaulaceae bacterium]